ncbi:hypothetical protein TVAG_204080 [Trichomonas vaginalis G3]|uniref:Uncharacterized protein n=1 Tax=Trichomonas vaginalis (strain ATCC PRA-98 / G3) TaxID=412133 RepID=A2FXT8_TRIV3|nr:hypothetical protein TVAG_204080 [Trichomonas vaginalis G3]|eukprot:XP_001303203.1 hypothetical protein [Trichomonas vaginalis G3]
MFNIPSICEYFISHGANINEKNDSGETALYSATWFNCKEIVEILPYSFFIGSKTNHQLIYEIHITNSC